MELTNTIPKKTVLAGYVSLQDLSEQIGASPRSMKEKLAGFKKEIELGRYNDYSYIQSGHLILINIYAFLDYLKYKDRLDRPSVRGSVPSFNAKLVASMCHPLN